MTLEPASERLSNVARGLAILLFGVTTAIPARAQTFMSLAAFNRTNGDTPEYSPLVQGADGNLYGTTAAGGNHSDGVVFRIATDGTLTVLYNFDGANGSEPYAGLVRGSDGNFYGLTLTPTFFKITSAGSITTLHTFAAAEGTLPYSSLVQASDGNLYGTTYGAGVSDGTIFQITPGGALTTLHSFVFSEGSHPRGALIQATDGALYGTTSLGGAHGNGMLFKITTDGTLTKLYDFGGSKDGGTPFGPLLQTSDGNFYGTTRLGGSGSGGTVYKITPGGTLTTLHSFNGADGKNPTAGLVQGPDGNYYGTTEAGGANNDGTVFQMTPDGTLTTLHSFDARAPIAALALGPDGRLYGTTSGGGPANAGTVYSITLPTSTPPVISPLSVVNGASFAGGGVVPGEIATIFGSNLTSATGINLTSTLPLPGTFLNSSVIVNSQPAPLFAVDNVNGQQQINFQVPWEAASGPKATLAVENNGEKNFPIVVFVLAAQPGIFNYSAGGKIFGAILHASFALADSAHPAKAGETVLIYCTGLGAVSSPPADGAAGNGQVTTAVASVTIGGQNALVTFSGLAPGFVGLYQVNAEVPAGLAAGDQPVVITLAGASSNSVLLPVQ